MRSWPPFAWLAVYVGSVLILMGSRGDAGLLIAGGVLVALALGYGVHRALRPSRADPRVPGTGWWLGGLATFYAIAATAAGVLLGVDYALVTLAAGAIPGTAVALVLATVRSKSAHSGEGVRDASADRGDDPFPGIGADSSTPLGDTSEHSGAH
jgi:hypothetical protein